LSKIFPTKLAGRSSLKVNNHSHLLINHHRLLNPFHESCCVLGRVLRINFSDVLVIAANKFTLLVDSANPWWS
jgi:hypothetical protein